MILPDTTPDAVAGVAERLRLAVAEAPIPNRQITLSIGVASLAAGSDARALIQDADAHLYQAKTGGRNLVCSG